MEDLELVKGRVSRSDLVDATSLTCSDKAGNLAVSKE